MSRPERDQPAFRRYREVHDRIQLDMLDEHVWPTGRLLGLSEHHIRRFRADEAMGLTEQRDAADAMTLACALLAVGSRLAADVDCLRRRERQFSRAIHFLDDGVACFLGATLRRDRLRLGLIVEPA